MFYIYGEEEEIWTHRIEIVSRPVVTDCELQENSAISDHGSCARVVTTVLCVGGEGHPAAENVGGSKGWKELKIAYNSRKKTAEQEQMVDWFEELCVNGDEVGLKGANVCRWDMKTINQKLENFQISKG